MARAKISQAVPICKPPREVEELGHQLLNFTDLHEDLKRMINVLEIFREDYIEDIRDLHAINSALLITLQKIVGQMDQTLTQADQSWRRLAANSG